MGKTGTAAEWTARLEPVVAAQGMELVKVEVRGEVLRVYLDCPAGAERLVGIEDCERVSRSLSAAFEELGEYSLEVSSPGLDRPLGKTADFDRFAGRRAHLKTRTPIQGSRNFYGILQGGGGSGVRLLAENGSGVVIAWDNLEQARLAPLWPAAAPRPGKKGK